MVVILERLKELHMEEGLFCNVKSHSSSKGIYITRILEDGIEGVSVDSRILFLFKSSIESIEVERGITTEEEAKIISNAYKFVSNGR